MLACQAIPPVMKLVLLLWQGYHLRGWCDNCTLSVETNIKLSFAYPLVVALTDLVDKVSSLAFVISHLICVPSIRGAIGDIFKGCCRQRCR